MTAISDQPFLYQLMIGSRYKIWRHLLVILSMAIIATNLVLIAYEDCMDVLGNKIYGLCLCISSLFVALAYLNIYVFTPKFLLNKKYISYLLSLSLAGGLLIIMLFIEYGVRTAYNIPHRLDSYTSPMLILSNISIFAIMLICFSGASMTKLFKHQTQENDRANQLEKEHAQLEVDQLKDQITPNFLSNILRHTTNLVKTDPEKGSDMLMRLGQLLRYQLYDCSREKVLLSSEINFLKNYLDLECLYTTNFNYTLSTAGDVVRATLPPLLFIPFVQYFVNEMDCKKKYCPIHLHFKIEGENLIFTCQLEDKILVEEYDFLSCKQRVELLYGSDYSLHLSKGFVKLQLKLLTV